MLKTPICNVFFGGVLKWVSFKDFVPGRKFPTGKNLIAISPVQTRMMNTLAGRNIFFRKYFFQIKMEWKCFKIFLFLRKIRGNACSSF